MEPLGPLEVEPVSVLVVSRPSLTARVKVLRMDDRLDLALLPRFLESAVDAWASSHLHMASTSPSPESRADSVPDDSSSQAVADTEATHEGPQVTTLANFKFRSSGKISQNRLDRAASLGSSYGSYIRGETSRQVAAEAAAAHPATSEITRYMWWAVLRPARGVVPPSPSVHNRRGHDYYGYWTRVAVRSTWHPDGVLCSDAVFEGFASFEEAIVFFESAGIVPSDVLDFRR